MNWRILLQIPSFPPRKQSQIIVACMALRNFTRETDINDEHFIIIYVEDSSDEDPSENSSLTTDDIDMCAFRDAFALASVG